jgi:DNA polymerase I-like protein with 3'-5' exonuclease and polymerase domains
VVGVVSDIMEHAHQMSIPLSTEARWGMNWDEMKAVE